MTRPPACPNASPCGRSCNPSPTCTTRRGRERREERQATSGHGEADFEAKRGLVPGTGVLVARAANGRASHDGPNRRDGVTWVDVDATLRADATMRGLAPGVPCLSRLRVATPAGKGDGADAFSLLVS